MKALYDNVEPEIYYMPSLDKFTLDGQEAYKDHRSIILSGLRVYSDYYESHAENDGIGWYEWWGHSEYDEGHDYGVLDDICDLYIEDSDYIRRVHPDGSIDWVDDDELKEYIGIDFDTLYKKAEQFLLENWTKIGLFEDAEDVEVMAPDEPDYERDDY